ncbi:MAG TPA: trypsin-like peptidase domain-containing protein [Bryobacteraceae bacterium]|jgi:serine protease Do|nr:trypsin-like peptidase domain-containing protein [Bryobacteraceae bacterium]
MSFSSLMSFSVKAASLLFPAVLSAYAFAQKPPAKPNPEKMDVLKQLSGSFEEISQRSGRAVVQIFVRSYATAAGNNDSNELLTAENSSGSGIILSSDGYVLTNAHVVKNAHSVKVQLNVRAEAEAQEQGDRMNRPLPGTVVGIDRESDLAVIKIDKKNLPYLEFGNSDELKQGQIVLALGNPLGLDNSVSLGVVSAVARQIKQDDPMVYVQTDAPINPGNSGGPLVDAEGHVMGINTFILTQSGGSEGIGFAIPSNLAKHVFSQLKTQGHVHRAQLGIYAETITPAMAEGLNLATDHGVVVSDVRPDGAAANAGIKLDDIITGIDGRRLTSVQELNSLVYALSPGAKADVRLHRGEQVLNVPVMTEEQSGEELDALADMVDPVKNVVPELGVVGLDITKPVLEVMPDLRRPQGVVVVARKSPTEFSGPALQTGDVIYELNRQTVPNVMQLRNMVANLKPGQPAVLLIEREGHLVYIALELD